MATAAMPHCCQVALGCVTIDFRLRATDLCHPYMYGIPFFLLLMITGVLVGSLSIAPDFPQKRKKGFFRIPASVCAGLVYGNFNKRNKTS